MHIPDGFLSTPVWLTLDVVAVPAVGYLGRKAQQGTDESRVPMLGVMGAFVFAAQMVNFPVGVGTSGHLVGSALVAYTLGPAAAAVVMTAILVLQALVFQDGGFLALGANVFNMALVGVAVAYLPYRVWGSGRWRKAAIMAGAFLSVFVGAMFALSELLLSGIPMPSGILLVSLGLFAITALIEAFITLAVLEALERLNPAWVPAVAPAGARTLSVLGVVAILLGSVGALLASSSPDGLEKLAEQLGISERATNLIQTPLADYQAGFLASAWTGQVFAGLAGLTLVFLACVLLGRLWARWGKA